jgi:glycosyltransferase involved in cell wall biosynthesis
MKGLVLISAYDSADTLPAVLGGLKRYSFPDVVVVDDGSTDGTANIARSYGAHVIRHRKNRGKGAALQSGFRFAESRNADFVITRDADEQHPAGCIRDLLSLHEKYPDAVLLGTRERDRNMPRARKISNALSAFLISLRCGRKIRDAQCGYRLIPAPYYRWHCSKRRGFIFESETLICLADNGVPFHPVPVPTLYPRNNKSKMTYFRSTFGFISMYIASFFKNYRKAQHDLP